MPWQTVFTWIARCSFCCSLIICICLLIRNANNSHRRYLESTTLPDSSLRAWSAVTFLWCICGILIYLANTAPFICNLLFSLREGALIYPHIFIGCYRLAQLRVINNTIQSSPPCVFVSLYVWATCIVLYLAIVSFAVRTEVTFVELSDYNGCFGTHFSLTWKLALGVAALNIFIWNWLIIFLYVRNITKIKRLIQSNDERKPSETMRNSMALLNVILNKVVFLAIVTEVISLCVKVTRMTRYSFVNQWAGSIGIPANITTIFIAVYLMLEHNEEDYMKLLSLAQRCGCLKCCCCCFGDLKYRDSMDKSGDIDDEHGFQHEVTIVRLKNNPREECIHSGFQYEMTQLSDATD